MTSQLIAPPQVQPITLVEAKAHIRVSSDDEDDLISELIDAATQFLERETGIALIKQSWRLWIDALPQDHIVRIPRHPVQRIVRVTRYDSEGMPMALDQESYFLNALTRPARLRFNKENCPAGICNGFEIDFEAGFGSTGAEVPDTLRRALLVLIAHWYEFRGAYSADDHPVSVPEAYNRLVRHYRQVRL